jgi:peroxiredoxin
MSQLLTRALAGAVLAFAICSPALAEQAATPPDGVQSLLASMRIEKARSVAYQDQAGKPIGPDEFLKQVAARQPFNVTKKVQDDGVTDVTLKLITEEAAAAVHQPPTKLKPGDPFPAFRLIRADGKPVDNKALEGRYTLVNFYFAQCAPCIKEVPELNALAQSRKDVNVLALTFDSADETKRFVADTKFSWPVVPDARKLIAAAGVKAYPSMALLDPQGRVVEIMVGQRYAAQGGSIGGWLDKKIAAAR